MEWSLLIFLFPVVFIAGVIDSIAGGGGLLTVPAYLIAGIPPTLTLGTNKFVSTLGTAVSTSKYIWHGRMLWPVVVVGLPCTLVGAAIGARIVAVLDQAVVQQVILILLPIAAALTLIPKPKGHTENPIHWRSPRLWLLIPLITVIMGWYDGFFGPGTGTLLMLALYGLPRLSFLHAATTARMFNLVSNFGALVVFIAHGAVIYPLAVPLALASIGGHYLGSHLALKNGAGLVRWMLAVSCTLLFSYLLWQQFR